MIDRLLKRKDALYVQPLLRGLVKALDILLNGPYMLIAKQEQFTLELLRKK